MIKAGAAKADDPALVEKRSVLVSALTGRKVEIVDQPFHSFAIELGDVIFLASDGLDTLSEQEIACIVEEHRARGAERISVVLLETVRARRHEQQDNTTVAVARVLDVPQRLLTDYQATAELEIRSVPLD